MAGQEDPLRSVLRSRHATSIGDQLLSSLINFALTICVARTTAPDSFGRFAIAFALFVFFLGLSREVVGALLLVRYSRLPRAAGRWERGPLGAGAVVGLASMLTTALTALVFPQGGAALWLVMGLASALALQQDGLRYIAIATQRPLRALRLDAVWAIVAVPAMVVTSFVPGATLLVIGEWALGAALAWAVGMRGSALPAPAAGVRWLTTNRRLGRVYASEYALLNGANLAIWFLLAAPLTTAQLGGVRGALFLFSPLNPVFSAITLAVLPGLVAVTHSPRFRELIGRVAAVTVGSVALYALVVLLLPDAVGRAVLGATWPLTADLRLPAALHHVMVAGYTVLLAGFRARQDLAGSFTMRAVFAVLTLLLPVLLAAPFGPVGASAGLAAAALGAVVVGLARSLSFTPALLRKEALG